MTRILLQTTIPFAEDDWHVGRFSRLAAHLAGLPGVEVTARDRAAPGGQTDPVLGGLMITRDHMDLGSSVCPVGGVGEAHYFHSSSLDPDPERNQRDDRDTDYIDFPNYHSGSNGDWQPVRAEGEIHPLLRDEGGGVLDRLPAHPHEGGIGAPPGAADARVITTGVSTVTGRPFNIAVAFEGGEGRGRGLAQSTFHHFADYNWDPGSGCPSFVSEAPGDGMLRDPEALRQTRRYMTNLARWLSGG